MKKRPEPITCPNCGRVYGVARGRCDHCNWIADVDFPRIEHNAIRSTTGRTRQGGGFPYRETALKSNETWPGSRRVWTLDVSGGQLVAREVLKRVQKKGQRWYCISFEHWDQRLSDEPYGVRLDVYMRPNVFEKTEALQKEEPVHLGTWLPTYSDKPEGRFWWYRDKFWITTEFSKEEARLLVRDEVSSREKEISDKGLDWWNCWDHDWYPVSSDGMPILTKEDKGDSSWHYVCQKCGAEYSRTREPWEREPPPPKPDSPIGPLSSRSEITVKIELPTTKELRKWLVEEAGGWEAYASQIRTHHGMIFQPSEETKRLWDKVRRTRRKSALLRAAQKWLEGLAKDSERIVREYLVPHSFEKDSPAERWRQILLRNPDLLKPSVPELVERSESFSLVAGQFFSESALGPQKIELATAGRGPYALRKTLLHETLHWLDWLADIPWRKNHAPLWEERRRKFERMFPP